MTWYNLTLPTLDKYYRFQYENRNFMKINHHTKSNQLFRHAKNKKKYPTPKPQMLEVVLYKSFPLFLQEHKLIFGFLNRWLFSPTESGSTIQMISFYLAESFVSKNGVHINTAW